MGAALLLFGVRPWLLDRAEYSLLDARFRLRGPEPVAESVVIVAIDAASLDEFGRWPWSRSVLAELLDRLAEAGVVATGIDLVLSESEPPAPMDRESKRHKRKMILPCTVRSHGHQRRTC